MPDARCACTVPAVHAPADRTARRPATRNMATAATHLQRDANARDEGECLRRGAALGRRGRHRHAVRRRHPGLDEHAGWSGATDASTTA
jgi:hypothetical protein